MFTVTEKLEYLEKFHISPFWIPYLGTTFESPVTQNPSALLTAVRWTENDQNWKIVLDDIDNNFSVWVDTFSQCIIKVIMLSQQWLTMHFSEIVYNSEESDLILPVFLE